MDSVEARREARRRRILENSEQRLKKITGVENRCDNPNNYNIQTLINEDDVVDNNTEIDNIAERLNRLQTTLQQKSQETVVVGNQTELKEDTSFYYRHKFKIIAILAIINYCLYWNMIFLPLILFEITLWLKFPIKETYSRLDLLLNFVNIHDEFSKNLLSILNYITQILQDLMVYFFIYVCCNLLANLEKLKPLL